MSDKVLVCTRAHTTKILADSASQWEDLQIDDRMIATGIVAAYVRLTPHQIEKFEAMPAYVGAMPEVKGRRNAVSSVNKLLSLTAIM